MNIVVEPYAVPDFGSSTRDGLYSDKTGLHLVVEQNPVADIFSSSYTLELANTEILQVAVEKQLLAYNCRNLLNMYILVRRPTNFVLSC